ncbi:hypothetical protein PM082_006097 [Marasmius tenuissimus]|nr:hypothetical protein PM082_006097 [Marasmius tenuissimus]
MLTETVRAYSPLLWHSSSKKHLHAKKSADENRRNIKLCIMLTASVKFCHYKHEKLGAVRSRPTPRYSKNVLAEEAPI